MTVTIDLPPQMQEWLTRKLQEGQFRSPAEFIQSQLYQEWLEEKMEEALQEPPRPVTAADWAQARQRLEQVISNQR
jgi:Arc/MetJ-type ribon-helix-helix transcriptional regulator